MKDRFKFKISKMTFVGANGNLMPLACDVKGLKKEYIKNEKMLTFAHIFDEVINFTTESLISSCWDMFFFPYMLDNVHKLLI